jgi:hypothetical protein
MALGWRGSVVRRAGSLLMKKFIVMAGCGILGVVLTAVVSRGLVETYKQGEWPDSWPASMEMLRDHAKTLKIEEGTQENIYEIAFSDRDEFEKAWPAILSVKTPGAPLRLYRVGVKPPGTLGQLISNDLPAVRIYGPAEDAAAGWPNGQMLRARAPWPKEFYGEKGELPEFVRSELNEGKLRWVKGEPEKGPLGFYYRARIDVDLVVDGKVIDLNRIGLAKDGPIEDDRF